MKTRVKRDPRRRGAVSPPPPRPPAPSRARTLLSRVYRSWIPWCAIAATAMLLRVIYLSELRDSALFSVLIGDARRYDQWAQEIAGGQWLGHEVFYQTPLYPYVLGVVYAVLGHHLLAVRVLQASLGAASSVLLGLATRHFFASRGVGLIAGFLLAVSPLAIFFDGLIQKSSVDVFLVTLLLALMGAFLDHPRRMTLVAAGVALAAFTLNRENARVLVPVVAGWLLLGFPGVPVRRRVAWVLLFTVSLATPLVLVAARNYVVGREFLLSTSQAGPNFYIGNHQGAPGSYEPLVAGRADVQYEREDATRLAEEATGRRLSPGEVSSYWLGRGLDFVRRHPFDWLRLMGWKLLLMAHASEITDTESIDVYADDAPILRALRWFDLGIVLPLAAIGAWRSRRDWRRLSVLYVWIAAVTVATALFYVMARYRYPLLPPLMMFAAAAASPVPPGVGSSDWRREWLPGVLLAVVLAVVAHLPLTLGQDATSANVGNELIRTGRPLEAIPVLEKAVRAHPGYAPAHLNLGVALSAAGDRARAIDEFRAAIRSQPDYADAHAALGLGLLAAEGASAALPHLRDAVRYQPMSADFRGHLGYALAQAGQLGDAVSELQASLRLNPDNPTVHTTLANTLREQGRMDEALQHYREALRLKPDAESRSNLASALAATGDYEAAVTGLREAVREQPDRPEPHANLGGVLLRLQRTEEAIAEYEQAAKLAPDSIELQYLLAQAYGKGGRLADAIRSLEAARSAAERVGNREAADDIAKRIADLRAALQRQ